MTLFFICKINDHVHRLVSMRIPRFAHDKQEGLRQKKAVKWPIRNSITKKILLKKEYSVFHE